MLQVNKFDLKILFSPYFLLIFSAVFFTTLTDQYLQNKLELLISSKDGLTNMIWLWGGLSVLNSLFFPLLISLLCIFALVFSDKNLSQYFGENLELSLLESIRAWGKTFLWSFVFLLPGVWKYINYFLAPFVVVFSKKYKNGEVDALEYSTYISKNFWWSLKLWLGVFYVLVPIIMYVLFDSYRLFSTSPVSATALVLARSFVELLFHFIILKIFIKFINENEVANGTHV